MHHICPKCDRPLTKPNAWHYCQKISLEDLLKEKPLTVSVLLHQIVQKLATWEGVSYSATKSCVVFLTTKTFLVIKVMKAELDLKFVLPEESDAFPIYKIAAYGKKLEHYIRLREEDDLDGDVWKLLRLSYDSLRKVT